MKKLLLINKTSKIFTKTIFAEKFEESKNWNKDNGVPTIIISPFMNSETWIGTVTGENTGKVFQSFLEPVKQK